MSCFQIIVDFREKHPWISLNPGVFVDDIQFMCVLMCVSVGFSPFFLFSSSCLFLCFILYSFSLLLEHF